VPAFVIVEVDVHDPQRYERYKAMAHETVHRFGGRYVVRGGRAELLEGEQAPRRVVVLEFPTYERAKEWWASAEYAPAKELRQATSTTRMVVVEGM
jgi:uncharacterized protein (DUF1330 family)